MRLVFAGTPAVALPSLEAVLASSHEVVAVLTRPDAPSGRGRQVLHNPVRDRAEALGLEVLTPWRLSEPEVVARLREIGPDCCPVVAYGGLVPLPVLLVPRHGWVNLHFSVLPSWRGAAPVQHALMAGDPVVGATTFKLDEGLDTGPVYGVMTEMVRPGETAGELLGRVAEGGAGLLVRTLDGIEDGSLRPQAQPAEGVSRAPKITVDDARVDWSQPVVVIERRIRGCTPSPGAWTTFRGERLKLGPVTLQGGHADAEPLEPGRLEVTRRWVRVGCGSGSALLGEVQPPGRRPMPATDWARGARLGPDERLG